MGESGTTGDLAPPEQVRRSLRWRWVGAFVVLLVISILAAWMSSNILAVARLEAQATVACAERRAEIEEAARFTIAAVTSPEPTIRAERRAAAEPALAHLASTSVLDVPGSQLVRAADARAAEFLARCRALLDRPEGPPPNGDVEALNDSVGAATRAIDDVVHEAREAAHAQIDSGITTLFGLIATAGVILVVMGAFIYIPTTRLMARTEHKLRETNDALRKHLDELSVTTNDLRHSHARAEAIFNAAADGIITLDAAGTVESMNSAAERLFGLSAAEAVGRNVSLLMPPELAGANEPSLVESLRSGAKKEVGKGREVVGRRKDGSTFPLSISIGEVTVDDERRFIGILRDVSDRRKSEESLSRQADELARSNAELEQFAYVASHDLQEPLRAIASFSSLLSRRYKGRLDEQADEFIGYVESGARRMHELIRDLLEYSRVSRRREPFTRVSSEKALDDALENLQAAIAESKPKIERGSLPEVTGDAHQLTQLFQNLVGNALKFRTGEEPRVVIAAVRDGRDWRFSVRDNGIGLDPRFAERIFVIFQRLHTRDRYGGNGIGLAICKKIVERHGGRIWVESKPGEGAHFQFTLPAHGARA